MWQNAEYVGLRIDRLAIVPTSIKPPPASVKPAWALTWPAKVQYNGCEVAEPQDFLLPGSPSDSHPKAMYASFHFRVKRAWSGNDTCQVLET